MIIIFMERLKMPPIFVDTSALIAFGNKGDIFHQQADKIRQELVKSRRTFLTTSLVVVELCNAFSKKRFRSVCIEIVEGIHNSDKWTYVDVNKKLMKRGFELFKKMSDKEWSLVDCVSIIIARDFGIVEVFTTDRHFEQAGFQKLLK